MAWRGRYWNRHEDDKRIFWAECPDGRWWSDQQIVPNVGSATSPTLASWNDGLYMAWRGIPGDTQLWWASFDGHKWTSQSPIHGALSVTSPVLVARRDRLRLYWRGNTEGNHRIYQASFDGHSWSTPVPLLGGRPLTDRTPAATSTHTARVYLALVGPGHEHVTLYRSADGDHWRDSVQVREDIRVKKSEDIRLKGTGAAIVGRVSFAGTPDKLMLSWRGEDYYLFCSTSDDGGDTWSAPKRTPARCLWAPALASWGQAEAYAAWSTSPAGDQRLYWAWTGNGPNWRNPIDSSRPLPVIPNRASGAPPAMAAFGRMLFT